MDIFLWIVIVALFLLSIAGIFLPVLPDTILLWVGFLLYHFALADPGAGLPASFWWGMAVITLLLYGADLLANFYFVKRYGGSKLSSFGAIAGVLLGLFVFPPLGMLILPFVIVMVIELFIQQQPFERAIKAGFGSMVAIMGSAAVKFMLQVIMIIWFFIAR